MSHICHAYRCTIWVPPRLLMCPSHWAILPEENKKSILATYRKGQENRKNPTRLYLLNQRLAVAAVAEIEGYALEAKLILDQAARIAELIIAQGHA